jgi:hypothetical protein
MSQERCVLDPVDFIPERVELDLDSLGLAVRAEGVDWGEAAITAQMVRRAEGEESSDGHRDGVPIRIPIRVKEDGDVSLAQAAQVLQAKFGTIQVHGGWVLRDFDDDGGFAGPLGYRILRHTAQLSGLQGWLFANRQDAPDVVLTATRMPIGYSTEKVESEEFLEESERELVYELPPGTGTAEGLSQITVTNLNEFADLRGLIWSEECRDYQEGPTAEPEYDAADLTLRGAAELKTVAGIQVVQHSSLTAGWMAILSSEIAGDGHMTHLGARRMFIRTPEPAEGEDFGTPVELKLIWRALGSSRWSEDNPIRAAHGEIPALLDMGEARPQVAALGDQRWEWKLMARAPSGSGGIRIHKVYPLSTEQFLVLSEPEVNPSPEAHETQSPKSVENSGGDGVAWTSPAKAEASDNSYATVEGEPNKSLSTQFLKATNFAFGIPEGAIITGVIAEIEKSRVESTGNGPLDLAVCLVREGIIQDATDTAGAGANRALPGRWPTADAYTVYGASEDLWGATPDSPWLPSDINDSGFGVAISAWTGAGTTARVDHIRLIVYYTEAEPEDRVCYTGRSVDLRSNGPFRQARVDAGDVWGEVVPDGFLPYAAPSGLEARPRRGIIIPTQGDLGSLPDRGSNKLSAVVKTQEGHYFAREPAGA